MTENNRNVSKQGNVESIIESELEETKINQVKQTLNLSQGRNVESVKQRLEFGR
jgi:hypothetical protein